MRLGLTPRRVLRAFGSVRLRVTVVAVVAFAVALIGGSTLLLHTLQSRLVGDIRAADQDVLQGQAVQVLSKGLPVQGAAGETRPVSANGTIAFSIGSVGGQAVVATTSGRIGGDGPGATSTQVSGTTSAANEPGGVLVSGGQPVVLDAVAGAGAAAKVVHVEPLDAESARVLGVAGEPGPFLMSSVLVYPGLALTTASSLAQVNRTLDTTRTVLWFVVPALVLLVAACAWLLVGRALRPVHALTTQAATINSDSLHERVPVSGAGDEITELATTINSMLERIETTTIAGRRLVSDASHELRTPITVIRTELEVARRDPNTAWDDVSANVLAEVDRLQQLVDDLLLLARMNERPAHAAPYSALDLIRDVAGRRRRVPVAVEEADGDHADTSCVGDGPAIARAVDHVVANAARHAATQVVVSLDANPDRIVIHVDDDGPGIAAENRVRVLQRFERLDEARSRDGGGSGLGLAVAVDVATAHGGSVVIGDSTLGGARVSLELRTAPVFA